jgi:hypothetical protein
LIRRARSLRALGTLACACALLLVGCGSDSEPQERETIVLLWWEGVPPQVSLVEEGGRVAALPHLTSIDGLRRHAAYYPSSDLSESRLATVLIEDGRYPEPAGRLDWGSRRVPEGALASELREAGYRRLAAVSRAELACLDTQFDLFAAPPFEAAPSALANDFALRALDPALESALASDDKLFLLVAVDVLARRDLPPAALLAPHLSARLAPLAETDEEVPAMLARLAAEPVAAAEALREQLSRRRGAPLWDALQAAEADVRLARVDSWLGQFMTRLEAHSRRTNLRLIVAGGAARDPWDAALGANDEGRALLCTLGMPLFYGPVQEHDLRAALRSVLREEAREAEAGANEERGPEPFVTRVTTHAGASSMVVRCYIETPVESREEIWISDVEGERSAEETGSELSVDEFLRRAGDAWQRDRIAAKHDGTEAAELELLMPEGERASSGGAAVRRLSLQLGDEARVRTTRRRPEFLATWTGPQVEVETCSVGALTLAQSDLPVVPQATELDWDAEGDAPRFALLAEGPWQRVRLGAAGDGAAELIVESWPPREEPNSEWIALSGDAVVEPHPLRPAAWVVRGTAPLELSLLRRTNGRFGYCARIAGERVGAAATSLDGRRALARGSVTILVSSGAWNDAALYGAAPNGSQHALEWLGSPPREPVTLPSAAERTLLLRAARNR